MSQEDALNQAEAAMNRGDAPGAERAITQEWRDLSKAPGDALHTLATSRISQGDMEGAEKWMREAARKEPNSLRHHIALGHILSARGNNSGSVDAYAAAVGIDPNWPGLLAVYSDANYRAGRPDEAERAARQAISVAPTATAWDALSCALRAQGRAQEALKAAEEAISLDARHFNAQNSRGAALLMLNRAQEALQVFETLATQGAAAPVLSLNHGAALEALGRKAEARAIYDAAARRWPDLPNLRDRLRERGH